MTGIMNWGRGTGTAPRTHSRPYVYKPVLEVSDLLIIPKKKPPTKIDDLVRISLVSVIDDRDGRWNN
jgi:hypothetical protein